MITFVCWLWHGWRGKTYGPEHVRRLQSMLERHVSEPYRLLCITDQPKQIDFCDAMQMWEPVDLTSPSAPIYNCFQRLRLFDPEVAREIGDRIVSIDLDVVIQKDLDGMFPRGEFKILEGTACPYNGSLWYLEPGMHPHVWEQFNVKKAHRAIAQKQRVQFGGLSWHGSDQAWMSLMIPGASVWHHGEDVVQYLKMIRQPEGTFDPRIIFFAGPFKPWHKFVAYRSPEIHRAYMEEGQGNADAA